ncbi:MAG: hypothetical protein QGG64_24510, partial [Candidatus Latescibacteria bacterium]|nr:hypothetical protein [Candidatus Latescibacterota bacterium]
NDLKCQLSLDTPVPDTMGAYRPGQIVLENGRTMQLIFRHSQSTAALLYLHETQPNDEWYSLVGLPSAAPSQQMIPGQLILGATRAELVSRGVRDIFHTEHLHESLKNVPQSQIAIVSVLREGLKYGLADALHSACGFYCNELLIDAHADTATVGRRVEITQFKDQDLTDAHRSRIRTLLIGDSIASGTVLLGVLDFLKTRLPNFINVELIAPLAAIEGLARVTAYAHPSLILRTHIFETPLKALPPDFYYSAHFPHPEFHIRPDLEVHYRAWWGRDPEGSPIADTACAGYGWSEAFFNPDKQIAMINDQLRERHRVNITNVLKRHVH